MKKLNVPLGLLFGLIGMVNLLAGDWLAGGASALLGAGFFLSDLAYVPAAARDCVPPPLAPWRRYASILLVGAALVLFSYQIGRDIGAKLKRTDAPAAQRP